MAASLVSVRKCGYGHWDIVVERENFSRKNGVFTSVTTWRYTTTDSMSVDDYKSEDYRRSRKGEKALIRQAKWWGDKEIVKY